MTDARAPEATWFGQPRGLTVLFLTNMWEQFSYFGMRALLVYYMTTTLLFDQEAASSTYGFYTAFAYFTPIIGGTIADRWLGKRRAVTIGATVMAAGHFMMAFEPLFYPALATIALGNGLFLPTLPSQINDLYAAGDPRRPWAYNVYYVGVNVGAFLAPLICGFLGETYGWHWGFGAAGVGMLLGLVIYLAGGRYLPQERAPVTGEPAAERTHRGRDTLFLLLGIGLAVTVFRGAYEQIGNTVALWMRDDVNRFIGSFELRATWFFSLNPLLVMTVTPLLLARWRRQAEQGRELSVMQKMAMGAVLVGLSYALLVAAESVAGAGQASWLWLLAFMIVFTLGELYILPNGLGIFARLAPPKLGASTVAAWYFAIFTGSLAAGQIGRLWSRMDQASFFMLMAAIAGAAAVLLLLLDRPARRIVAAGEPGKTLPLGETR
ncbi:MAG: Di-tripeptide/cation symporter [uncultured Sphingosinicella sp.]|uniref:Di-tripeptide/cation symporter n=1 Tax=uncultured Sphingosinicella sp. TaxID=478748 RepID=A0A6J4UGV3_9SPHN|nr:peptide MFS transporter [uncultured Sphingosinicella sp.]CAA9549137.1 MAG: Di-tripeptide/cation symporter [uncultured Sphingosinicella sp.]